MFRNLGANIGLKITAFLMAVLIWIYVTEIKGPEMEKQFYLQIQTRNLAEKFVVTTELPSVTISIKGSKTLIEKIKSDDLTAYVDLLGKKEGKYQMIVNITKPESANLISIEPELMIVDMQAVTEKQIPIVIKYKGQTGVGVVMGEPRINPEKLTVSGPSDSIQKLKEALIEIDRAKFNEGVSKLNLPYILTNDQGKALSAQDIARQKISSRYDAVEVEIESSIRKDLKTVGIRPKTTGSLPTDKFLNSININPKNVTISGPSNILAKIDTIYTKPFNLNGLSVTTEQMVELELPDGLTAETSFVKISINIEPLSKKTIKVFVEVYPDSSRYSFVSERTISVIFQGPSSVISQMITAQARVNLANLTPGEHKVIVEISGMPEGITIQSTPTVIVRIEP
jgi:YbbR domain-containing protein